MDLRGIHFVVWFDCEPKRELTLERIADTLTAGERRAEFRGVSGDDVLLRLSHINGECSRRTKISRIKGDMAALARHQEHCEPCEANALHKYYGCFGYIPFPLPAAMEDWLWSRLPADLNAKRCDLFFDLIKSRKIDGTKVKAARAEGLLEQTQPLERKSGNLLNRRKLNANMLLEALFWSRKLADRDVVAVLLALGIVGLSQVGMDTIVPQVHEQITRDNLPLDLPGDGSLAFTGLERYFRMLFAAYRLGRPLVIYG